MSNSKFVSFAIALMMIFCGLPFSAQDSGEETQDVGEASMSSGGASGPADSPWPIHRCNLRQTGLSPHNTSANAGKLKWSLTTGRINEQSPVIGSDGTIYIGSDEKIFYAINPDGTEKWNFTVWTGEAAAISSDGTIYVPSYDHKLYAINPDGTEKWGFLTEGVVSSAPTIGCDGTIYVGSWDQKLYAIYPNGTKKWEFITGSQVHSSPAIESDGTIYFGSDNWLLFALNPDGSEKWRYKAGGAVRSSPAVDSDGTIYVGIFDDYKLCAINPDGTEKWVFTAGKEGDDLESAAIGPDGTIYVGSDDNHLYAVNPDGTEKWRFKTNNLVQTSPAVGSDGTIYIGSSDHILYAVNPDGSEKWNFTTGWYVHSSPAIGSDGTIYVGSWDGNLYAIGKSDNPPIANAGPDQTVNEGETVHFNGTGSYDPNCDWHKLDVNFATDSALHLRIGDPGGPYLGAWEGGVMEWVTFSSSEPFWIAKKAGHMGQGPAGKNYTYYWKMHESGNFTLNFRAANGYFTADVYDEATGASIVSGLYVNQGTTNGYAPLENRLYRVEIHSTGVLSGFPNDLDVSFELVETDILLTPDVNSLVYYISQNPLVLATEGPGVNSITFYSRAEQEFYAYNTSQLDHSEDEMSGGELSLAPDPYKTGISPGEYADTALDFGGSGQVSYEWDFDSDFDSDGDGDPTNDVDATGPAPTYIYGDDGVYEVTLTVKTSVEGETTVKTDLDVVFCIDSSGSMGHPWNNDPTRIRVTESQNFVTNHLKEPDRAAVVDFDHEVDLLPAGGGWVIEGVPWPQLNPQDHLSSNYTAIIANLEQVDNWGGTVVSYGLDLSVQELIQYGDPDHVPIIILLTDAETLEQWDIDACYNESYDAADKGITIMTIGLNINEPQEQQLLEDIANITGGKYFPAPDASHFEEIYEEISILIENETSEELSDTDTCYITVRNEPPGKTCPVTYGYGEEGGPFYGLNAEAIDPGSDDLTFVWDYGDGTNETVIFYNDGVGPEPVYDPGTNEVRSPWGTFPFSVSDQKIHIYGDDGVYYNRVTITDDDGGVTNFVPMIPTIDNVPPILSANIPKSADEGEEVLFTADGFDNGTDDLTFTWCWGDGTPDTVTTYYNNGISPEPVYDPATNEVKSPWGIYPFTVADSVTHIYGDDGVYNIMIMVEDDDGGENTYNTTITVNNVVPSIMEVIIPYPAEEGKESTFRATVKDEGSDDLTFEWDFGDLSSTITNTYYNDGINPDPYPSPGGIYPFIAQDTVDHTYGDDYDYNFTLIVTDDDGGVTTFTTTVIVQNVAPTIEPFGPFTVDEGSPFDITAISTDQGSDDLIFTWEFEDGPTITNTIYNDDTGPDPYPSPWGTYPFSAADKAGYTYGDDGNFTIILTVTDDDGGTAIYETYVLVNNVPPSLSSINYTSALINEPRTIGYWGHQCEVVEPYGDHTGILQEWVDNISSQSQVFSWISTKEDVCGIIQEGDASDMVIMAKRQLMGVWLNIVSGKVQPDSEIYMPNLTSSNTIWEAVQEIEYVILHSTDRGELERVKDIADNMNNGIGIAIAHVDFIAAASDPGADDLTFYWDFGDGKNQTNFYPNPNGTFPVEVTDHVGHSYFSYGTFTVTLTVNDDDGGLDVVVIIIII